MTVFKCKMCGGNLEVSEGASIAVCPYCETEQTLPTSHNDIVVNLFNKANYLRLKCEFDRAAETYEKILDLDYKQAEAHWGAVLCKYGIEYVDNSLFDGEPRKPTCHRTQLDSILTDADYLATIQYADSDAAELYKREADEINELQKKILNVVKNEKPFDVFICYKETDEAGQKTTDSEIANEIYNELSASGLKVFFSRVTLKRTIGEYEPYIYAALYSAKVMVVLGTKIEYFNAIWVKNEWSRYLHMMKTDPAKKRGVIPCYRDMNPKSLPAELSPHQALDMSSVSFMPTLIRLIKEYIGKNPASPTQDNPAAQSNTNPVNPLLRRAFLLLEDGEFNQADNALEKVLDLNPENAKAYIGKLMVQQKVRTTDELVNKPILQQGKPLLRDQPLFEKALRFADDEYKKVLDGYNERNLNMRYNIGKKIYGEKEYVKAYLVFNGIKDYRDSAELAKKCFTLDKEAIYTQAYNQMASGNYAAAQKTFNSISGYEDAAQLAEKCSILEKERIDHEMEGVYNRACTAFKNKRYDDALALFRSLPGYRNANQLAAKCRTNMDKDKKNAKRRSVAGIGLLKGLGFGVLGALAGGVCWFFFVLICTILKEVLRISAIIEFWESVCDWGVLFAFAGVGAGIFFLIGLIYTIYDASY